ncbi:hypothetical protein [Undibacterium sp. YM2]|uniref:hypothetical protein n=1 Tax=Undibacterium sp. YM2 TaxID=2058625 RepID=UPI00138A237E|nr:hypothetical protein [Undibacterium sp. YM2]
MGWGEQELNYTDNQPSTLYTVCPMTAYSTMKSFWQNLSPFWKTLAICLMVETGLFAGLMIISHSLALTLIVQIVVLGPASIFLAPAIYRKNKKPARGKRFSLSR